jgi:hypothetical protein
MAKPSFDEFADLLDEIVDRIPPYFCRDLSGGFNLRPGRKREGEFYTLGEYVEDSRLGCYIVFYYGSFVGLLGKASRAVWEAEMVDTVLHEMQHHREAQAGRDDLARQETQELARFLREKE